MATRPLLANKIQRQTVQVELPKGGDITHFFEKDAAGNVTIKNDDLKSILEKSALGAKNPLDTNAIKVSVGVDF